MCELSEELNEFENKPKKVSYFDENIDPECVPLIVALNQLDGIKTCESCCGHLKDTYCIWFLCSNLTSLAIITRTFDRRYSDGRWQLKLETSDMITEGFPTFCVCLQTKKPFKTWEEMFKSVNMAVYSLNCWNEEKFKNHFKGIKDKKIEVEE